MIGLLCLCAMLPLGTAAALMLFRSSLPAGLSRGLALTAALATLVAALALGHLYQVSREGFQRAASPFAPAFASSESAPAAPVKPAVEWSRNWLTVTTGSGQPQLNLKFHVGIDGISLAMIVLTAVLTISSILISWETIREREAEFYAALLLLEAGLVGVFCAADIVLFYVFFEITLIPLFFLIAIWGGADRRHAAVKFFLYTLAGSMITLLGLVSLIWHVSQAGLANPTSMRDLATWLPLHRLPVGLEVTLFLAISAGFLVKVPVFPFHTWLPLAHVEAPTAGSVMLAGILLKLGTYGFLRLCLPLFPYACYTVGLPLLAVLAVIGIIHGSKCALVQRDIKRLVAYSSVAHLGFCMLGLFALNTEGVTGGVLQMLNHGLSTGALFLIVGMIYDRYHTRKIDDLGGLATRLPLIACCMVFITMSSIGLPGLNGFVGEMLALAGMFKQDFLYAALGATGVVLGAWYMLTMLQQVFFGNVKEPAHGEAEITDLTVRESLAVVPLMAICLWIGVFPGTLINLIQPDIEAVTANYTANYTTNYKVTPLSSGEALQGEPTPIMFTTSAVAGAGE